MSSDERMLQELMLEQTINEFNDTIKIFENLPVDDEVSPIHNTFANIFSQKVDMVIRGSDSFKEKTRKIDYLKNFLESKIREFHTKKPEEEPKKPEKELKKPEEEVKKPKKNKDNWQGYTLSFPEEYISSFPEEYILSFSKKGGKPRRGGKSTRQRRGGKSRRKQTKRRL